MRFSTTFFLLLCMPTLGLSATIHVPGDYPTIQQAIDAAVGGDTVLVAPGTFTENIDFKGKAVTVESSGGSNLTVIDGGQLGSVVTFSNGVGLDSVLRGFTVTNGSGTYNSSWGYIGGGIACFGSSPTIENNRIVSNSADIGGGLLMSNYSSPKILANLFSNNTANQFGGGLMAYVSCAGLIDGNCFQGNFANGSSGGAGFSDSCTTVFSNNVVISNSTNFVGAGVYCHNNSDLTLMGNLFQENVAGSFGGGIACWISSPIIRDNKILKNSAGTYGGGIGCRNNSSPLIINNMVTENTTTGQGGGIDCFENAAATLLNNTLCDNSANKGGGIACRKNSKVTITNTVLWNNTSPTGSEIYLGTATKPSTVTISFSDVKGGQSSVYVNSGCTLNWGAGMIDADPIFVDPANGDFHLTFPSPCKDTGDDEASGLPDEDFENDPRIAYGTVDMGADEFYTHLYWTGDATPGGSINVKMTGVPATSPVGLFIGFSVYAPPLKSMWGEWHLAYPWIGPIALGSIPGPEGVLVIPGTLPGSTPGPYNLYLQSIIGAGLTNLCELVVQ